MDIKVEWGDESDGFNYLIDAWIKVYLNGKRLTDSEFTARLGDSEFRRVFLEKFEALEPEHGEN